ncbi:peptidase S8/S53 domain-containing protein [Aspergillus carlsbadensis]|nr:peptidase S8/S53 domain-containing protein [Aspergillus carlsbadensis]
MSPSRDIEPSKRKTKKKVQETDDRPSLHWEKVADLLKLHFLRSTFVPSNATTEYPKRRHNDAERFLFGSNSDNKSLCFSFPPTARKSVTIDFEDFKQGYSSMTFDKTLLYVNFGQFDLTQPDKGPRTVRNRATGRDDLGKFFSWLQEKQVRYIIKVMVSEDSKRPHSDEAIINALKPFQVEILDWQKLDLCPAVLQEVGKDWSNLHEIHLRWSGNNAVLRAWSEPEGLAMLEHLTTLHVYETERPLDSATYIGERVEEFKGRLNAARKGHRAITVVHHPFDGPTNGFMGKRKTGTQILDQGPKAETMNEHLWLTIMDRFVQAIRKLEADRPPEYPGDFKNDKNIRESLKKDITVALIDDGVNFMNRAVSRNLMGGKCFPSEFGDDGGSVAGAPDPPFHGSSTEHGTRMAYFIQRICPAVKIFVCKIDVMQRPDEKANFTAKSAADAVEYAVEHEFDIVSMSWTVEEDSTSSNSRDHFNRIQKALERKDRRMPLLFCSAPDIGHHKTNDYYPFGCKSITNMFRIGAATVDGLAHPRVSDDVDYILPGHNVLPHSNDLVGTDGPMTPMTGSSVATALAAGLAALIIHCVRLGAIYNATRSSDVPASRYSLSDKSLETIKTYSAMRAAFDFIKGKELPGASEKRLGVEGCFKDPGDDLAKREKDFHSDSEVAAWETVREIARNLVPYDPSYGKGRQ